MFAPFIDPARLSLLGFFQAGEQYDSASSSRSGLVIGVVLIAGIGALLLFGLGRWEGVRGRQREVRAAATAEGFDYYEGDPYAIGKLRFDTFLAGTAFEPTGVVETRRPDKRRLLAFDYQLVVEYEIFKAADGSRHRRRRGESNTIGGATIALETEKLDDRGSAGTTNVDAFLRNVVVLPHGWDFSSKSRLPASYERNYGPEEFSEKFTVRSDAPEFAERFLSPKMMKFMVATGTKFGFEVRGNQLMIFGTSVKPGDLPDLARLTGIFHDLIDKDLLSEFPQVSGVDSNGNPQLAPTEGDALTGFPGIDFDGDGPGPVLPDTLSGQFVPILSDVEPAEEPADVVDEQAHSAELAPAVPTPPPEPESIDWSL